MSVIAINFDLFLRMRNKTGLCLLTLLLIKIYEGRSNDAANRFNKNIKILSENNVPLLSNISNKLKTSAILKTIASTIAMPLHLHIKPLPSSYS